MAQKVLIVDDEESIVTLLQFNIERAGFETETAFDGMTGLQKALQNTYDIIVLDLMLPELDGTEVCKQLRQKQIDTPILMLTARDEELDKVLGLELGADDYLTKPFSPKEVVARIKAILRRTNKNDSFMDSGEIKISGLSIFPDQYEASINGDSLSFTRKEFELLMYLAKNKGRVMSRDQLLSSVWNYDFVGDTRIVDVHISHLREKIEPDSKHPVFIKTIRGLGYKMEEPQ
ncbi:two-component system, OmpR family, alkaline phosphatase synthesis response regulator PhoP [Terribacillus aidingensis]|uniref:Two-component system, OmpR family, alkaline phosphatase synthesis response regulator PhoP n=1 Tax=Terribacillus aidingensis TaxID=586416 RepID=A0A285NW12_9BACI|nr:response regulator transcription factor [Terribacillus aidingensis]SNZ11821.1 two-component system, OmpR family, alkaline phosphatase synthesis response regulator PhoP [Terribacillus aidingensis]